MGWVMRAEGGVVSRPPQIGKLIVLEGPDGVGKSTLSRALTERLQALGAPCVAMAFPGNEEKSLGRLVYDVHHDPRAFGLRDLTPASLQTLHVAAHLDALERFIIPNLRAGRWVVLDRSWWSTWVYAKVAGIGADTLTALIHLELLHWDDLRPHIVFVIDRADQSGQSPDHTELQVEYENLMRRERLKYPVKWIKNDGPIKASVGQMLNSLVGSLPGSDQGEQIPLLRDRQVNSTQSRDVTRSFTRLSPARPTAVYDTYWKFAAKRQDVFFRKFRGDRAPWTDDPIIARYKFTNAYRASDRVSQYLIREVIYKGSQSPKEVFFRTILFKLFNKIETWELLTEGLGSISYESYSYLHYDRLLSDALLKKTRIYSAAYIMPTGRSTFGHRRKHRNHLELLDTMMRDDVPHQLVRAPTMATAFEILRSYPTIGDFLAYQYVTDLNYAGFLDYSEMEFVVAGPGALDGIHKCFEDLGGLNEADVIRMVTERQEREFERLGLEFKSIWGRPLQLIDCQNLFCEVSKYARVKHPNIKGTSERRRIKQKYRPLNQALKYWYPPKWGINDLVEAELEYV